MRPVGKAVSKPRPGLRKPQSKDFLLLIGEDKSNYGDVSSDYVL